jgi:hypothetical protein
MKNRSERAVAMSKNRLGAFTSAAEKYTYFALALAGFSFWFFLAVPFASHRETYWWLAMTPTHGFATAFSVISVTYRPLAQGVTWLAFVLLDGRHFPTSLLRQSIIQFVVFGCFVAAWWFVYRAAAQKRVLAWIALVAGGVFFPGYVHLFHVYGLMYVPVMLMLGWILFAESNGTFRQRELQLAVVALVLIFWHPFATALFIGFYFGFYFETFRERSLRQHLEAAGIMLVLAATTLSAAILFPRGDAKMSLSTRAAGFLISYQTNEVNLAMSAAALVLAVAAAVSMARSSQWRVAAAVLTVTLGALFSVNHVPVVLLWLCVVLIKLLLMRRWGLFCVTFGSALLPFGAGIGAPVFALFGFVFAVYATALDWPEAEIVCSKLDFRYVGGAIAAAALLVGTMRAGIKVPVATQAATPLLSEREKTYQLESVLAWLHQSSYCGYEIGFEDAGGSPLDSLQSAINRRNRPPSSLDDVELFWDATLKCNAGTDANAAQRTAMVTFGSAAVPDAQAVYRVPGQFGGDATVWIRDPAGVQSSVTRVPEYRNQ